MNDVCPGCGRPHDGRSSRLCLPCQDFADPMQELAIATRKIKEAQEAQKERKAERARLVWEAYLVAIADESLESFEMALAWSERAVDAFLKWRDEQ